MDCSSPSDDTGHPSSGSPGIPLWGWAIGLVFFPGGGFFVLAWAKAWPWWRALLMSLGVYTVIVSLISSLLLLPQDEGQMPTVSVLGLVLCGALAGHLQYAAGCGRALWSHAEARAWRMLGVAAWVIATALAIALLLRTFFPEVY
jgi:hypothetical protein